MGEPDHGLVVAVIGCGVIGSGWAARFRLRGVDVRAHDPSAGARARMDEVQLEAEAAWDQLGLAPACLGSLTWCPSVDDAVAGAALVQESVPERLDVKREVLGAVDASTGPGVVVASSTSGFRPTVLAEGLRHPERLVVAHPFNPVYLLPLVEVVAGTTTAEPVIEAVTATYRALGMHPLRVRTEIDAFIADRLLEAVWREALWLIADGVATTAEVDDAIRYGFGLRWAQMGLFETYRLAGGEGGMRQFIAQFADALDWPWSRLTDTPTLTDELVERIVAQSDEQSGSTSGAELARRRDRNLAAVLLALEGEGAGAGRVLGRLRRLVDEGVPVDRLG